MSHGNTIQSRLAAAAMAVIVVACAGACAHKNHPATTRTYSSNPQPVFVAVSPTDHPAPQTSATQPGAPGDPFAWNSLAPAPAPHPTVYHASHTTTPAPKEFRLFGELGSASGMWHPGPAPFDATENLRQVTFAMQGEDFDPCISRDGRSVIYASTRHRPTADIYIQAINGTAVTQLTNDPAHDVMPAISPDGKRVAFASNRSGSWDIYIMNTEGGQAVQVTADSGDDVHPTWSPDGRQVAFSRLGQTSNRWEIWVADLTKPSSFKFLTFGLFPAWHPTEDRLLFQRSRDRGDRLFSVWTVDLVNGEAVSPTEIASSPTAAVINPTWSPDGQFVAVSTITNPDGLRPEFADIWIVKADGSSRTNLTNGRFVNILPVWAPDNKVLFVSNRNGQQNIWQIGPEQAMLAASISGAAPKSVEHAAVSPNQPHNAGATTVPPTSITNADLPLHDDHD